MSNPLSAPISITEEPNVSTVGEFLAGVLNDVLDEATITGFLTTTDVDALEGIRRHRLVPAEGCSRGGPH